MKTKTAALTSQALDWAVAKADIVPIYRSGKTLSRTDMEGNSYWAPSTDWSQGGPIIEREEIGTRRRAPCMRGEEWEAMGSITAKGAGYRWAIGPTPLVAAMRCLVAAKLGDEVEIPEALS